jgi:hypothetical protein
MRYFDEEGVPQGTDDEMWFDKFRQDVEAICQKLMDHGCYLGQEDMIKLAAWQAAGDSVAKGDRLMLDSLNMTTVALARAFANDTRWVKLMQDTRGKRR